MAARTTPKHGQKKVDSAEKTTPSSSPGLAASQIDNLNDKPEEVDAFETMRRLRGYLWPKERPDLRLRGVIALGLLVASKLVAMSSPYIFKLLTDTFTETTATEAIAVAALATGLGLIVFFALTRVLSVAIAQVRDALFAKVAQYSARRLANATFRHLHSLSLRFHLGRKTGGLSRVIERAARGIEILVRFAVFNTIPVIFEVLILFIIFGLYFDFRYVLVLLATTVSYIFFTFKASEWRIAIRRKMNEADSSSTTKTVDSLLNFETVKYFGNEQLESERFDHSAAQYEDAAVRTYVSLAWLNAGQMLIYTTGVGVCMAFSAYAIAAGEQTVGDLVMVNMFMMQLYLPLNFLGTVYREIRQSLLDIGEMFALLDRDPEITDDPDAVPLSASEGAIRFEDVKFHYNAERPILRGLTFEVKPGQKVAIVGASGAGKSTISRLLYRFYDVTAGQVLIDGQDIRTVQQQTLRKAVGMVPQDTVLFNDTIGYNIGYGRTGASEDEIIEAAKLAQIHDFIEQLPDGYQTMVGERGLKLSGGEKQRVAIARTILKAPPILVLDEATSALDTDTEKEIQSALRQVAEGRTTIVIAHRLSTVIDADMIIVLEAGEIVERGTHGELLDKGGRYANLWHRQLEVDAAHEKIRGAVAEGVVRAEPAHG